MSATEAQRLTECGSRAAAITVVKPTDHRLTNFINNNDLLAQVKQPDPKTGNPSRHRDDQEFYAYNALGERILYNDRREVRHDYEYDTLGRMVADVIGRFPTGSDRKPIDMTIQQLRTRYDSFGRPERFSSLGAAGNVVNEVLRQYNGFGQVAAEFQEHFGPIGRPGDSPAVGYVYAGPAQGSRLRQIHYPGGRIVTYNYNGLDDAISRVTSISDNRTPGGIVETYQYLGLGSIVERIRPEPGITLSYVFQPGDTSAQADGGDQYAGLDRFGRVIDQFWFQGSAANPANWLDRFQYGYDANANRLYRVNLVPGAERFGELYHLPGRSARNAYDPLNRLNHFVRGPLTQIGGANRPNALSGPPLRLQSWVDKNTGQPTMSVLGNWLGFRQYYLGDLEHAQSRDPFRTHEFKWDYTAQNIQNQPTFAVEGGNYVSYQTKWIERDLTYDGWNRVVQDTAKNVHPSDRPGVGNYRYDALGRLIQIGGKIGNAQVLPRSRRQPVQRLWLGVLPPGRPAEPGRPVVPLPGAGTRSLPGQMDATGTSAICRWDEPL